MSEGQRFPARVRAGEPTFGIFLSLGSRAATLVAGASGLDWVLIDLEHGSGSEATLAADVDAARRGGASPLVRVESIDRLRMGRALDLGADGLMAPRVESADDARHIAEWAAFPPHGRRGVATMTPAAEYGRIPVTDLLAFDPLVIIQIESTAALADLPGIAGLSGIDVLFVGPLDLTTALGCPGRFDAPEYAAALEAVVRTCRAHGKAAGILLQQAEQVPLYLARGFSFIGVGSDAGHLAAGLRSVTSGMASWR